MQQIYHQLQDLIIIVYLIIYIAQFSLNRTRHNGKYKSSESDSSNSLSRLSDSIQDQGEFHSNQGYQTHGKQSSFSSQDGTIFKFGVGSSPTLQQQPSNSSNYYSSSIKIISNDQNTNIVSPQNFFSSAPPSLGLQRFTTQQYENNSSILKRRPQLDPVSSPIPPPYPTSDNQNHNLLSPIDMKPNLLPHLEHKASSDVSPLSPGSISRKTSIGSVGVIPITPTPPGLYAVHLTQIDAQVVSNSNSTSFVDNNNRTSITLNSESSDQSCSQLTQYIYVNEKGEVMPVLTSTIAEEDSPSDRNSILNPRSPSDSVFFGNKPVSLNEKAQTPNPRKLTPIISPHTRLKSSKSSLGKVIPIKKDKNT